MIKKERMTRRNNRKVIYLDRHHPVPQSYIANPADLVEGTQPKGVRLRSQVRHRLLPAIIHSNPRFRINGWQLQLLMQKKKIKEMTEERYLYSYYILFVRNNESFGYICVPALPLPITIKWYEGNSISDGTSIGGASLSRASK